MYGVSYDLFWHLNPKKLKPFSDAYKLKTKAEDRMAWRMGIYIQIAIASCFPKSKAKYPESPLMDMQREINDASKEHDYGMDSIRFGAWAKQANKEFREQKEKNNT